MTKERKITRTEETVEEVQPVEVKDAKVVKQAVNETVVLTGGIAIFSIRVVGDFLLFNDKLAMKRVAIKRDSPITVTIKQ